MNDPECGALIRFDLDNGQHATATCLLPPHDGATHEASGGTGHGTVFTLTWTTPPATADTGGTR